MSAPSSRPSNGDGAGLATHDATSTPGYEPKVQTANADASDGKWRELFLSEPVALRTAAVLITATFITALATSNLGLMVELVGACGGNFVTFIGPGAAYTRLRSKDSKVPGSPAMRAAAMGILVLGVIMLPITVAVILVGTATSR